MTIMMTMLKVNIAELKAKLSDYLAKLAPGEPLIICNRNEPIGEIVLYTKSSKKERILGFDRGKVEIKPEFFDPLPKDIIDRFYEPTS